MFSFRSDKAGFFSGLVLLVLVGGAGISTLVLWLVGGWEASSIWIKVILGVTWVLCITTVYVRVLIFRRQMQQNERKAAEEQAGKAKTKDGGGHDGGIQ